MRYTKPMGKKKPYRKARKTKAKKARAQTNSLVRSLKNYYDYSAQANVGNAGNVVSMMNILQGSANNQRLGDTVAVTSYYCKIACTLADATNYVRLWLILDKASNGSLPTLADMFTQPFAGLPQLWKLNDRNKYRFRILRDKTVKLDTDDPTAIVTFKDVFKRPIKSTFLDNSGTVTAFGENHLYLVMATDSTAVAHPLISHSTRTYYLP